MHNLLQDIRYAVRGLSRSRTFTIVTVLEFAIGVYAKTIRMLVLVFCMASVAQAQRSGQTPLRTPSRTPVPDAAPAALTIEQAVSLAVRNNPDYLSVRNNRNSAAAELRSARGGLLPQLNASLSGQYQQGGRQFVSGVSLGSNTDALQSAYNIGLTYRVNAATFIAPRLQRANSAAVEADIAGRRRTCRP